MKLTIKTKLIITLCLPLLLMGIFYITSIITAQNTVLEVEKKNVKESLTLQIHEKLQGQVDTVTFAVASFYEHSKLHHKRLP